MRIFTKSFFPQINYFIILSGCLNVNLIRNFLIHGGLLGFTCNFRKKRNIFHYILFSFFLNFPVLITLGQLSVSFSAVQNTGCVPFAVQFQSQVSGGNSSNYTYLWDFGNGNTSNQPNPIAFFNTLGSFTISLTVSDGVQTATATLPNYITTNVGPTAQFSLTELSSQCLNKTIAFQSNSIQGTAPIVNYLWLFGNGQTSNEPAPVHTYTTAGTFDVTLIITSADGCQSSYAFPSAVSVMQPDVDAYFSLPVSSSCQLPFVLTPQNLSNGPSNTQYFWNFGNGMTSTLFAPSITYSQPGSYTISLAAYNPTTGCSDTFQIVNGFSLVNNVNSGFQISSNSICVGQNFIFSALNQTSGVSYNWNFGNGETSNITTNVVNYTTPGAYNVTLSVQQGGCSSQTTQTVTVNPQPEASFSIGSMTSLCQLPVQVSFNNTSNNATSFIWNFGGAAPNSTMPNPTITINNYGNYNVRLIAFNSFGCSDTMIITNLLPVQPFEVTISANPPGACSVPQNVNFSASPPINQVITSYQWTFHDGTTSTAPNPNFTYNNSGIYGVSLIATSSGGCVDTVVENNIVSLYDGQVIPSFTMSHNVICAGYPVSFTNTSLGGAFYTWLVNGNVFSNLVNPSKIFYYPDTVEISLVGAAPGCPAETSATQTLVILPSSAIFTMTRSCDGSNTVVFSGFDQSATSLWLYPGDGSVVNVLGLSSYTHTYTPNSSYVAYVLAQNTDYGCYDTLSRTFFVPNFSLDFSINPSSGCVPLTTQFTSQTTGFTSVRWGYGTGQLSQNFPINSGNPNSSVVYVYNQPGVYHPFLIGSYNFGNGIICRDTIFKTIQVFDYPLVDIIPISHQGCGPVTVQFQANASPGAALLWEFGNNNTSTLANPSFTFPTLQNNSVALTATLNGCSTTDTLSGYALFPSAPEVLFTVSPVISCPGLEIQFNASITGGYSSIIWQTGDGNQYSTTQFSHQYLSAGVYQPVLKIYDLNGCEYTHFLSNPIIITKPNAEYAPPIVSQTCPPVVVNFQNLSQGAISYLWNFDNGSSSNTVHPTTAYIYPGHYQPYLIAWDENGCSDTAFNQTGNIIVPGPILEQFLISDKNPCPGQAVEFSAVSPNADVTIINYDTTGQHVVSSQATFIYPANGTYYPFVTLGNQVGNQYCLVNFPTDTIVVAPLQLFVNPVSPACYPTIFNLNAFGNSTGFNWSPTSYIIGNSDQASILANPPISTWFKVQGYDEFGCENLDSVWVEVLPKPQGQFSFADKCYYDTYQFQDHTVSDAPIVQYSWNFSNIGSASLPNPIFKFPQSDTFTVILIVTNQYNCSDTVEKKVFPYPKPLAEFLVKSACEGSPAQVNDQSQVSSPFYITNKNWFVNGVYDSLGMINSNGFFIPGAEGANVMLEVETNVGCRDTAERSVILRPKPIAAFSFDNPIACSGEPVEIQNTSVIHEQNGYFIWHIYHPDGMIETFNTTLQNETITYMPSSTGNHNVMLVAVSPYGCTDTLQGSGMFYVSPPVFAAFDLNPNVISIMQPHVIAVNLSTGYSSLMWDFGDGTTSSLHHIQHTYQNPGEYKVTLVASNEYGCKDDTTALVTVTPDVTLYVPNSFTPGGQDGINDYFSVKGIGISDFEIIIYDRWGEKIFQTNDFNFRWDGKFRGKIVQQGTYAYRVIATDIFNQHYDFHGHINILY